TFNMDARAPISVGGNVVLNRVGFVDLGEFENIDTIGGSLFIQDQTLGTPVSVFANLGLVVQKNVSINTGSGNDFVVLDGVTFNGDTQLNLGEGNDLVVVVGDVAASGGFTQFNGNFSLTEGSGNDTFATENVLGLPTGAGTTIAGNATFQFGSGND